MVEGLAEAWTMPLPVGRCDSGSPRAPSYETGREGSRSQQGSQDFPAGAHTGKIKRSALETDTEVISHIEDLELICLSVKLEKKRHFQYSDQSGISIWNLPLDL